VARQASGWALGFGPSLGWLVLAVFLAGLGLGLTNFSVLVYAAVAAALAAVTPIYRPLSHVA
jgi:hypothetical protein